MVNKYTDYYAKSIIVYVIKKYTIIPQHAVHKVHMLVSNWEIIRVNTFIFAPYLKNNLFRKLLIVSSSKALSMSTPSRHNDRIMTRGYLNTQWILMG